MADDPDGFRFLPHASTEPETPHEPDDDRYPNVPEHEGPVYCKADGEEWPCAYAKAMDEYTSDPTAEGFTDDDLPGMWSRSDFE